jgi:hypothetical protein
MSLPDFTVNSKTFSATGPMGRYMNIAVSFGDPLDYFKFNRGTTNPKTGQTNAAVSRIVEIPDTDGIIHMGSVQLIMQISKHHTTTVVDDMISDIDQALTPTVISHVLLGGS